MPTDCSDFAFTQAAWPPTLPAISGTWQVVWFKRDLRVADHAPLHFAAQQGPVLAIYVFEPSLQAAPDYAPLHGQFIYECLQTLSADLANIGIPLYVTRAECVATFHALRQQAKRIALHSHEETGNGLSYQRDLAVAQWCHAHQVCWTEYASQGVVRRLAQQGGRDKWTALWEARMQASLWPTPLMRDAIIPPVRLPCPQALGLPAAKNQLARQVGGRRAAENQCQHFFDQHLVDYRYGLSSPLSASQACSRLSPYLAYGVLSLRQLIQHVRQQYHDVGMTAQKKASLRAFESRLHWHCHFIQKLETEPDMEYRNLHPGWMGLREENDNAAWQAAWAAGETGYPLIDACMRMLQQTGWINFRMRAMLVSFSSYQLWQPWQKPAHHLARCFLDYEPGIHYPQIQMQSGVTGINAVRIYNPIKQAQDHDPKGIFVRRWLPALRRVPPSYLFQPWLMPQSLQAKIGVGIGRDYPFPLVELVQATRLARERYSAWRHTHVISAQSQAVLEKHGSRVSRRKSHATASPSLSTQHQQQMSFDWEAPS